MTDRRQSCWIGFDLGGTKMMATVFDSDFRALARKRKKTRGHEGVQAGLERMEQTIHDALKEAKLDRDNVSGIGIGCPGPLDLEKGVILDAPNLGWNNVPVADHLQDRFACPAVIANDVDVGVYAESRFGAARDARCAVGVFPGTGIGGGCVYDGRIIRGRATSCMEIGHLRVMPDGPRCGCGLRGCLEAVASRLAISSAAARAAYRGQAPHLQKLVGSDISKIRSGTLAESVEAGDVLVEEIIREACRQIGIAIAGVVHLLAPDAVVLGGGLVEAMPKLFVEEVDKAANAHVMPSFRSAFRTVAAELGDDATVMGAAAWTREVIGAQKLSEPSVATPGD